MGQIKRRVLGYDGAGRLMVVQEDVPQVGPGEVLIEVEASLVSPGTEMHFLVERRKDPDPSLPLFRFGYAAAGHVLATGAGCEKIAAGSRLACMGNEYALHATHVVVPQNLTVPLPENLSFEEGTFCHLACTALHAIRRGDVRLGDYVAVFGLGIVGQLAAQLCRLAGARVMAVDRLPGRVKLAAELGADLAVNAAEEDPVEHASAFTGGHGMDVAIVAFGGNADEAMEQVVATLKTAPDRHKMGAVVIVGLVNFRADFPIRYGNVDFRAASRTGPGYHDPDWERGRDYPPVFVRRTTQRSLQEVMRLASEGRLRFGPLITHRVSLDEAVGACEELIARPDRTLGVVIQPQR